MTSLRAALILAVLIPVTLLIMPLQFLAVKLRLNLRKRIPVIYHRFFCRMIGARVTMRGTPVSGTVLLAANHASWLDIPILSSLHPVSFVAKEDVDGWAFFGSLARLQETVFVRREARSKVAEDRDVIRERLMAGDALVIFPEGTSTDGNRVRIFKSALLSAAQLPVGEDAGRNIKHPPVQPVSIAYVGLHGMPMGRENRPFFAWYGDMELLPHLWEALRTGPIDVIVQFHPPLSIDAVGGRKRLAAVAQGIVQAGLVHALHGGTAPTHKAQGGALLRGLNEDDDSNSDDDAEAA